MGIKNIRVRTAKGIFRELDRLSAKDDVVFRGHRDQNWRLESTLARHVRGGATELSIRSMDEMLDYFFSCLASIGQLPERAMSTRSMLEFARHHGVPSPLIDFSRSPYIALWMACDGARPWQDDNAVVYALDLNGLGILWQKLHNNDPQAFGDFRDNANKNFSDGLPIGVLMEIDMPTSWNIRMLRQLGMFVYDSIQYGKGHQFKNLEQLIEEGSDPKGPGDKPDYTLHKIIFPKSLLSESFSRLELMGIDGTRVYNNHEGAVADVKNSYVFNRRVGFTHDRPWRSPTGSQ